MGNYKPNNYNSVSPYFIVEDAERLIDLLVEVFNAEKLREYRECDDVILHAEIRIDDSVLMFGTAIERFPANKLSTHIYVKDVDSIFKRAMDAGCVPLEQPKERQGDPDRRGSFKDFAGNIWSIGTQKTI